MNGLRVVGFDTSLSAFGMVAAQITAEGGRLQLRYVAGDVIKTEKDASVKRTGDDLLRRFRELALRSWAFVRAHDPHVITVEQAITPVGKRGKNGFGGESPQVGQNLGRARGLVDALAAGLEHVLLLERSSQAIKKAATGNHLAEKADMIAALERRHPEIVRCYPSRLVKGEPVPYLPLREHVADAAGSILAVLGDLEFQQRLAHVLAIDLAEAMLLDEDESAGALSPAKEGETT